jgi:hypothetical protein
MTYSLTPIPITNVRESAAAFTVRRIPLASVPPPKGFRHTMYRLIVKSQSWESSFVVGRYIGVLSDVAAGWKDLRNDELGMHMGAVDVWEVVSGRVRGIVIGGYIEL